MRDHPAKPDRRPHCYICAKLAGEVEMTQDFPPQGFFPDEVRKSNLLTVDCCKSCNNDMSLNDEAARIFFSLGSKNDTGQKMAIHYVIPSLLLEKKKRLLENVTKSLKFDDKSISSIDIPPSRANPFVRRMTKASLYEFFPDYDYFPDYFTTKQIKNKEDFKRYIANLTFIASCPVFEIWGTLGEDRQSGLWVFRFYDGGTVGCIHGKDVRFKQNFPLTYKEHGSLPKYL